MNLPDTLKIRPLQIPIHGPVSVPGSKSLTNRSLILAALAPGKTVLTGALWSEDTELMVAALQKMGFSLRVEQDHANSSNRTIHVQGENGKIPGSSVDINVGTAGTVARFIAAFCALGKNPYKLHGSERMHKRPMKAIFEALKNLGARVQDTNGFLPATIEGPLRENQEITVDESESSQFASALLLISQIKNLKVHCSDSPYIEMTRKLMEEWKTPSPERNIEPDASSASYFLGLMALHGKIQPSFLKPFETSVQIDASIFHSPFWDLLKKPKQDSLFEISRKNEVGDAVLTLLIAAFARNLPFRFKDGQNLRLQECDRISAMKEELSRCGGKVEEHPDGLTLKPPHAFQPATIQTYNDHRMAMCFALLGTVDVFQNGSPWISIQNPSCVQKTFPNFFETLEETSRQSHTAAGREFRGTVLDSQDHPLFT